MMNEQGPDPDDRAPDGEQPVATTPTVVQQAGQLTIGRAVIVVHRTLADEHSPYAVLRTRHEGVVADVPARPGQEIEVPGRSEERRVGKEGRARGSAGHENESRREPSAARTERTRAHENTERGCDAAANQARG